MAKGKTNQSGLSSIEVIVAALVILGIGVTATVLIHRTHMKTLANTTTGAQRTTNTVDKDTGQPENTVSQTMDIKEWGVHLTLNSDTSSLYYYINPQLPNVAYLSLKTIAAVAPNCAANKTSLGAVVRLTPAEQQEAPDATYSTPGTIEIGNYWYGYSGSPAACSDGTTTMNNAISQAAPNFTGGTLQDVFNTISSDQTSN
jgi:hypothetical protein